MIARKDGLFYRLRNPELFSLEMVRDAFKRLRDIKLYPRCGSFRLVARPSMSSCEIRTPDIDVVSSEMIECRYMEFEEVAPGRHPYQVLSRQSSPKPDGLFIYRCLFPNERGMQEPKRFGEYMSFLYKKNRVSFSWARLQPDFNRNSCFLYNQNALEDATFNKAFMHEVGLDNFLAGSTEI